LKETDRNDPDSDELDLPDFRPHLDQIPYLTTPPASTTVWKGDATLLRR